MSGPEPATRVGVSGSGLRAVLGRRRRANAPEGRRQFAHQVKVSAAEEAVLVRLAAQAGVSVPRLLVEAALAPAPGVSASERREGLTELFTVSRVLAGIATNLNQLARVANATGEFPAAAAAVRERIRELIPRVTRAMEGLSDPGDRRPLDGPPGRSTR